MGRVQRNGHTGGDFNIGGQRGFPPMGPRGPMVPLPPNSFPTMNKYKGASLTEIAITLIIKTTITTMTTEEMITEDIMAMVKKTSDSLANV